MHCLDCPITFNTTDDLYHHVNTLGHCGYVPKTESQQDRSIGPLLAFASASVNTSHA